MLCLTCPTDLQTVFVTLSMYFCVCVCVFFYFSCLFVLPIFKAQTNNDSLPKCHKIEHNPADGWRLCGPYGRRCNVIVSTFMRRYLGVVCSLGGFHVVWSESFNWASCVFIYIRGSCKKFCHWVLITSVLRFIKHILLQTFKVFPLYWNTFCKLFTQSRKADT